MNEELNDKLNYIDKLLNNDSELNNYINSIESSNIDIPINLENTLIKRFKKNIFMNTTIKIFKIAACTLFALIIWNTSILDDSIINSNNTLINKNSIVYQKINNTMEDFNRFLLTPINLERNDK